MFPARPAPGDVLDDKYRLLRVVGEGGMGVVFEAVHVKLGQRVAIKVLQASVALDVALVSRFEREARAAGRLRGRNVARVTDVEASPGKLPYMVMEFLEGHDLEAELSRREGRRVPAGEAVDLLLQACRAMTEAHGAGIVHRDLKPSNLFLCNDSGERVVKLLDFGVSKMEDDASKLTSTELVLGTVLYMSPEQIRSAKNVDARADIWAMSVILYELVAGRPPFFGSSTSVAVSIVNDDPPPLPAACAVPAGLQAAILKGMAKNPNDRFPSVVAFAQAIAPYGASAAPGSMRWTEEPSSPVVVMPRIASDAGLGTARTLHESAPTASAEAPLVVARTSPRAETLASPKGPRIASRVAIGVALAAGVVLVAVGASRGSGTRGASPNDKEPIAAQPLAPAPTALATEPPPAASPATDAAAPPALASAAPEPKSATVPSASKPKGHHGTAAGTTAHPPAPAPSPTPPPKEKPPLVAPF